MSEAKRGALIAVTQLLVVLAAAVSMVMLRRVVLRVLVFLAAVMALISAQMAGLLFRYWLPALMCAALAAALAFAEAQRGRRWRRWVAPGLMAVALGVLVKRELSGPIVTDLRIAAGLTSFSTAHHDFFPWQMWSAINSGTPADARILIAAFYPTFGACNYGAFWVDRRVYTTDAHAQQFIALDDWPRFLRSIDGAGITHVVISETMYASGRYGYSFPAGDHEYPFSRRLVDERGERLAQFGPLQLYRLRPNMPRAAAP
jgi:hypothetical protein